MRNLLVITFLLAVVGLSAQEYKEFALNRGNVLMAHITYGFHAPGGDLQDRFSEHFSVGGGLDWMTERGNWIFGTVFNYHFGNEVKENPLAGLFNEQGFLIGNDRQYADIQLRMRGFYAGAHVGKLIGLGFENPRSGIRVTAGAGLLQHKIRIQKDPVRRVPQVSGAYEEGYDRLTNGLAFTEFIGYQLMSSNGRINFVAGFEFTQGFTMNRRALNFDTKMKDTQERLDLNFGFRIGWTLPFYVGRSASEEIYY